MFADYLQPAALLRLGLSRRHHRHLCRPYLHSIQRHSYRHLSDRPVNDPLLGSMPQIFGDGVIRAYDGLMFGTRDAL